MTASSFEVLINAAAALTDPKSLGEIEQIETALAETYVSQNRSALDAARQALQAGCDVPLKYEQAYFEEFCGIVPRLRVLADAFRLELRLATSKAKFDDAVQIGNDLLELANVVRRGGLIISFLVAEAISALAISELRRVRHQLPESTRTDLIHAISQFARKQIPLAEIVESDRRWEIAVNYQSEAINVEDFKFGDRDSGLPPVAQQEVVRCLHSVANRSRDTIPEIYATLDKRSTAQLRLLVIDLAIRSQFHAPQAYPDDLEHLLVEIDDCLKVDPFTGGTFVYRKNAEDSFVLYSPGPGLVDHGGRFGHWLTVAAGNADFCLDVNDFPLEYEWKQPGFISRMVESLRSFWRRWGWWLRDRNCGFWKTSIPTESKCRTRITAIRK